MIRALCIVALALPLSAAEALSERIAAVAQVYEADLAKAFAAVEPNLERWRTSRRAAAVTALTAALPKQQPENKPFAAFHILTERPDHAAAKAVFTNLGLPVPVDATGAVVAGATVPACRDRTLADLAAAIAAPPFQAVSEVIAVKSSTTGAYWTRMASAKKKLVADMTALAREGQADAAYPMLAYYDPTLPEAKAYFAAKAKPMPRNRWWASHVDAWLIRNALAGIDHQLMPGDGGASAPRPDKSGQVQPWNGGGRWTLPEVLRDLRCELLVTPAATPVTWSATGLAGGRAEVQVAAGTVAIGKARTEVAALAAGGIATVHIVLHGRAIAVLVNGVQVAAGEATRDDAWRRVELGGGGAQVHIARHRFIGAPPAAPRPPAADQPKPPTPPAAPAWQAERTAQLDKPVSFAFADTTVEEAIAVLAQSAGVAIALDEQGRLLKDMPITLAADGMRLGTAFDWLAKMGDLACTPTEQGFTLTWKR